MCGQSSSHPQICAVQPNSSYWRHWNSATLAISQASLWSYPLHVVRRDGDTKRVMSNDCLTSFHWPVPSICANVAPRWGWFFVKMCRISTCGCSEESVAPMSKTRWTYLKLLGWFHTHCLHTHTQVSSFFLGHFGMLMRMMRKQLQEIFGWEVLQNSARSVCCRTAISEESLLCLHHQRIHTGTLGQRWHLQNLQRTARLAHEADHSVDAICCLWIFAGARDGDGWRPPGNIPTATMRRIYWSGKDYT